jgi:hypothetical protein
MNKNISAAQNFLRNSESTQAAYFLSRKLAVAVNRNVKKNALIAGVSMCS